MALHPSPSRILVIGGSPGTLREFLKYPVDGIDFVELDPKIIEVSSGLLNIEDREAVKDRRVKIIVEDGRRFIKRLKKPTYDLIVLNLPQPSTASINRFYTSDFFREAKSVLKDNGILALTIPQSTGYIGRSMQTSSGSIYNSLKSVFKYVEVTAQEYGGLFASESAINTDPEILENRFAQRAINTRHFNQYIFRETFSPLNVDYVRNRLSTIKFINTDLKPSAYLYNLMLWSEVQGDKAFKYLLKVKEWHIISISVITLITISFFIFRRKRRVIFLFYLYHRIFRHVIYAFCNPCISSNIRLYLRNDRDTFSYFYDRTMGRHNPDKTLQKAIKGSLLFRTNDHNPCAYLTLIF